MPHVVFAGGGTGGHIYPALAIAEELRELVDELEVSWLVSRRPVDARILADENIAYAALPAQPFGVRPRTLARFLSSWGPSVRAARGALQPSIRASRRRDVLLVAMGGFVAPPAVQAARAADVRAVLVNLDAVPGRANRWVSRRTIAQLTACDSAAVPASWERVRPIVRRASQTGRSVASCRESFGLEPERPTLLVTGGSQGAHSINRLMQEICDVDPQMLAGWQVIHQSGGETADLVGAFARAHVPATVRDFIFNMGEAWRAASLVIGRSGAGAVAEAWASATPAIFLPYPHHRDDHQRLNARPLVEAGGAIVIEDLVEPAATLMAQRDQLNRLFQNQAPLDEMQRSMQVLGPADGSRAVAQILQGFLSRT